MKIAIASSGLGHVARGIETWALDTAVALAEVKREMLGVRCKTLDVRCEMLEGKRSDFEVSLFSAAPLPQEKLKVESSGFRVAEDSQLLTLHSQLDIRVIPCFKRGDRWVKLVTRISPGFTWRWGLKSAYDIEQRSFWRHLWPILRDEEFDILHVQDPLLADLCRRYRKAGKLKTKEILAHGTEESVEFLEKFEYVQHLAPWHLEQALKKIEEKRGLHH
jgi:hypothetical protein